MRKKIISLVILSGIVGWFLLVWTGILIPNRPSLDTYPIRGIDVSHHNSAINWMQVADQNIAFAFIKATEGSDMRDSQFKENWSRATANGIVCGAYHFFSTQSSGKDQAENFIATVPRVAGMLPPVIDVEFGRQRSRMSDAEFHQNFRTLFDQLKDHYQVTPLVYTTEEFHDDYLADTPIQRLWVRAIIWKPYPRAENWLFWQYSSRGRVKGMTGRVDLNVFRGTHGEFPENFKTSSPGPVRVRCL